MDLQPTSTNLVLNSALNLLLVKYILVLNPFILGANRLFVCETGVKIAFLETSKSGESSMKWVSGMFSWPDSEFSITNPKSSQVTPSHSGVWKMIFPYFSDVTNL